MCNRRGLCGKSGAYKLTSARAGLPGQILFKQVRVCNAVRERKQIHTRVQHDPGDRLGRDFDLGICIGLVIDAGKRAFQLIALGNL